MLKITLFKLIGELVNDSHAQAIGHVQNLLMHRVIRSYIAGQVDFNSGDRGTALSFGFACVPASPLQGDFFEAKLYTERY